MLIAACRVANSSRKLVTALSLAKFKKRLDDTLRYMVGFLGMGWAGLGAGLDGCLPMDFLLLSHGHGCEDFEGMCCFNLSSRSTSIHENIQKLKTLVKDLKTETTPDWANNLFGQWGLMAWASSLVKGILWIFIVILVVLAMFSCLVQCLKKTVKDALFVNTERGIVEDDISPKLAPWNVIP